MMWILGTVLLLGGGWVCIQSTSTRLAPPVALAGVVILLLKAFQ
jgi:hypothetical protein